MKKKIFVIIAVVAITAYFIFRSIWSENEYHYKYYDSGQVKNKYKLENGELQGDVFEYYEDATIKGISGFEGGVQHGASKFYFPNGNLKREVFFSNGIC